jgi:uncharacterized membrane protein
MAGLLDALALVLVFLVGAVLSLALSTPIGALAIWRYAKRGTHLHLSALLASLLNGVGQGALLGVGGFALGATIGDERAGDAALLLGLFGLVLAGITAFVLSYLLVFVGCKLVARRRQRAA